MMARFPVRKEVDLCNNTRLADLVGWGETYEAVDTPGHDEKGKPITGIQLVRVLERMMVLPVIVLKVSWYPIFPYRCSLTLVSLT